MTFERPRIAPDAPCFLIAEIGINHNGDMDLACRMIEEAAKSGADAVKFQNYRTEDFIKNVELTYTYQSQGRSITEPQYDLFKRCELDKEKLVKLARTCAENAVTFTSTPTSAQGVADLVEIGAPLIKNGSDYLGNLPLIVEMAKTGLPTILSTGMALLSDIDDAVQAYRSAGGRDLILLHCVSSYPAPMEQVHLGKIQALAKAFDCPAGFSDHTDGIVAALGAVAFGACLIEKHFTLDRNLPGPDQQFSSDPAEFAELVRSVRDLERAMVPASIGPTESTAQDFKLSCVAARDLPEGHVLAPDDITFARPGTGLPPKFLDWLVGEQLAHAVRGAQVLARDDFR